ncbi:MAG: T9SS type A sorting domain-containing protein [Flavobacteriaceae bacterium]|nr:T9SS type A sorting domain-containing protein [Flavobacteriaceae bacterium]
MKRLLPFIFLILVSSVLAQVQTATFSLSPANFSEEDEITITVSEVDPTIWNASQPDNIYLWAWSFNIFNTDQMDSPNNGSWGNSSEAQKLTNNGNGTYSITFTPTTFYGRVGIGRIGFLVKAKDGSGDKKSQDNFVYLLTNELTLTSPSDNPTIVDSGTMINISATSAFTSDFTLKANSVPVNTSMGTTSYSYDYTVAGDTDFVLEADDGNQVLSKSFAARLTPSSPVPAGMKDGINLDPNDHTRATLVLYAPGKTSVHVIGDFNNWQMDSGYLMTLDTARDRFWIELTGLTPQFDHKFQYLVDGTIRIADPYSTTILDEFNDSSINSTTYPNLPSYPTGDTNHAVTLLRTGDASYNWQVSNFQPPAKTDLVIYELLIRDFDALHSYDAVKARLDYLENLGVNAIELMPVNEFDANESWGYNPSFHMALDKYYGTPTAFKEFIDECHSRDIAVILDVVFNHGTGQNPFYRMWNTDNGGYNGQASPDNPFFNPVPRHSYNVFNDFDHSQQATRDYVKQITQYWINEYNIDGFRWDLTKGFTQHCTDSDEGCTGSYQTDRVAVLKEYADYQWEVNPDFIVIFEHLGGNFEETEWVNYRLGEGKGIMMWGNHNGPYNEGTMGYNDNGKSDFSWISYLNRNWSVPANVSYMESHDEERLMFKNISFGNSSGGYDITNLSTALDRMELAGAFYFTVPGPKMIWQFGELGYDITIDFPCRVCNKPILWNYFTEPDRIDLYNSWAAMTALKIEEDIFRTDDFTLDVGNANGLKKIHLINTASNPNIEYVTIIGNFGLTTQDIDPEFQEIGMWYNLMDNNSIINVTDANALITLQPGEFKIYASSPTTLIVEDEVLTDSKLFIYPNPSQTAFAISRAVSEVKVFDLTGKLVKDFSGSFERGRTFDISSLSKGIYIVTMINDRGNEQSAKLLKM